MLVGIQSILPTQILKKASTFPISTLALVDDNNLQSLLWYLPAPSVAYELRSIYYTYAAWMHNPISVDTFNTQVYSVFYDSSTGPVSDEPVLAHKLSVLFMVLAIGSLMNTALPAYNMEAEKFHQLARAALFHTSVFDEPTLYAVQALYLMSYYLFLADRHGTSAGARWAIMGMAVKVGQSIGLHRDSGRWKFDADETQRRRELFWETFTYDSWQCLTFGRPPSFALPHMDCKQPYVGEVSDEQAFYAWKHRFTSECMNLLHDQAFGARMPTYATVLQLDRKLRAFPVPPVLQVAGFGSSESRPGGYPDTVMLTLQRHIVLAIREMNLLYLHRSFFARAISDHPKDPLGSPYGTSVIAAYRSAGSLVALMRNLYAQLKVPSERMWFLWTHMFSCAIVLGSIVTRCPSMSLAPSALVQLDSACELFAKAAPGFRANKVLRIMLHLQQRAHISLEEFRQGHPSPIARQPHGSEPTSPDNDNDELSVLGGRTRVVAKAEPSSPRILDRSPNSDNPVVPLPLSPNVQNPSVVEYLQSFGNAGNPNGNVSAASQMHSPQSHQGPGFSEISPVSLYGMTAVNTPTAYQTDQSSFLMQSQQMRSQPHQPQPQPHHQPRQQLRQNSGSSQQSNGTTMVQDVNMRQDVGHPNGDGSAYMSTGTSFPQYFPVYDYGGHALNGGGFSNVPVLNSNPVPGRRTSSSPEANMYSTWQDFVNNLQV